MPRAALVLLFVFALTASCFAQLLGNQPRPGGAAGSGFVSALCTKPFTDDWASGTKAFVDVDVYDGSGVKQGGTVTINFVNGSLDIPAIIALQGPQTLGSPTALPIGGLYAYQLFIVKWYSHTGANDAVFVPGDGVRQLPVLRVINNQVHIGFGNIDYDAAVTQPRLKLPDSVAINTRAVTVAVVTSRWKTGSSYDKNALFYTSDDGTSGVGIIGANGYDSDGATAPTTSWRSLLLAATDAAQVPIHADQQVLTLTSGASTGEMANDLGTASFSPPASTTGVGFVIGSLSAGASEYNGAQGNIDCIAVKNTYSTPAETAELRGAINAYFNINASSAIPNIAQDGDSSSYGLGAVYPAIKLSGQGSQGYGPTQQVPDGLKRTVRFNNISRGSSNFASGTGNSLIDRAPRMRALYSASASINIAVASLGAAPPAPGSATTTQVNNAVAWVTALRSTGQTWTIFISDQGNGAFPCAAAASPNAVTYRTALLAAAAANNFTVFATFNIDNYAPCFDALYGHDNLWGTVGHLLPYGLSFNVADEITKINAVLP